MEWSGELLCEGEYDLEVKGDEDALLNGIRSGNEEIGAISKFWAV